MEETPDIGIGSRLKSRRLELGRSITDIAEQTRIRKVYLESIEAEQFEALPGAAYIFGFVRSYAKAVDLPVEPLLQALRDRPELVATEIPDQTAATRVPLQKAKVTSLRGWVLFFLGVTLVMLLAGGVYWMATKPSQDAAVPDPLSLPAGEGASPSEALPQKAVPESGEDVPQPTLPAPPPKP